MNSNPGEHNLFQEYNGTSLFNLMVEFNLFPIRYVHKSWLKDDEHAQLLKGLSSSPSAEFGTSSYLLNKFGVGNAFDYDFARLDKRAIFASAHEIRRLAFYLGLILNESTIRSVIRRDEREALANCIGEEAYRFAVKKAQFIAGAAKKGGPSLLIDFTRLERFKAYLEHTGQHVIATAFSDLPEAFSQRLMMKMPSSWQKVLSSPDAGGLSKEQCEKLLVKTHKEVNRQWRHLLS